MKLIGYVIILFSVLTACHTNDKPRDNFESITEESILLSSENKTGKSPYITKDEKGNAVASWVEGNETETYVYYARWNSRKQAFGLPTKVDVTYGVTAHPESMPKLAFKANGTAYVFFHKKELSATNRFAGAIYYTYSTDEKQWSKPAFLHSDSSAGTGRSFFDVERLADGEVGAVWLDGRKKQRNGSTLMFAKTNAGNTFEHDIEIAQKTCQCCRTELFVDQESTIHVVFRDIYYDSIRDMAHLSSTDNGLTFSTPQRISADNWVINGCPHTGPTMAEDQDGLQFYWFTSGGGDGVYSTSTADNGATYTPRILVNPHAQHPQVRSLEGKIVLVWDETFKTDSTYIDRIGMQVGQDERTYISSEEHSSDHPVLSILENGDILLVWVESKRQQVGVKYRLIKK